MNLSHRIVNPRVSNQVLCFLMTLLFVSSAAQIQAEETVEYNLAVINAGGHVSPDDITVKRFRSLLPQLVKTFGQTPKIIGTQSAFVVEKMEESGIKISLLEFMEGMNSLTFLSTATQDYPTWTAMYMTLRDSGQSHQEAIKGLDGLVAKFSKQ